MSTLSLEIKSQRKQRRWERRQRRLTAFNKVAGVPELLVMIFAHCIPTQGAKPNPKRAPLNLSHVSRYWRAVAHETPSLWAFLRLSGKNCLQDQYLRQIALLKHWLSLSSNAPLTLWLSHFISPRSVKQLLRLNNEDADRATLIKTMEELRSLSADLLKLAIHHVKRWRHVEMIVNDKHILLLDGVAGPQTPLLEYFRVHADFDHMSFPEERLNLDFLASSKLREIHIICGYDIDITLPASLRVLVLEGHQITIHNGGLPKGPLPGLSCTGAAAGVRVVARDIGLSTRF